MTDINDLFIKTHFKVSNKIKDSSKYRIDISVLYQEEKETLYIDNNVDMLIEVLYYLNLWKKEDTIIKSMRVTDLEINILILVM